MPTLSSSSSSSTTVGTASPTYPVVIVASNATNARNMTEVCILSAAYGPSEGRRLLDGATVRADDGATWVPHTRDVLPFLGALLGRRRRRRGSSSGDGNGDSFGEGGDGNDEYDRRRGSSAASAAAVVNAFPLLNGRGMNAVFGDPCPGTTKLLRVSYVFRDGNGGGYRADSDGGECDDGGSVDEGASASDSKGKTGEDLSGACGGIPDRRHRRGKRRRKTSGRCSVSEVFHSAFAEHERVVLRRKETLHRIDASAVDSNADSDGEDNDEMEGGRNDFPGVGDGSDNAPLSSIAPPSTPKAPSPLLSASRPSPSSANKKWRLRAATSEIVLPIILPLLSVRRRARCQLVCRSWRRVVRERGIARSVDVNDASLFHSGVSGGGGGGGDNEAQRPREEDDATDDEGGSSIIVRRSRTFLRGVLAHSHSSLESLVLNDFVGLVPRADLHPSLPHLRKLKRLDVSRCPNVGDETFILLANAILSHGDGPASATATTGSAAALEVLYMKGLRRVTDSGVTAIAQSCRNLRVLDVSHNAALTDASGTAIGTFLRNLEVLHCRDNFRWTDVSVGVIARNCTRLSELTFWGCIGMRKVRFGSSLEGMVVDGSEDIGGGTATAASSSTSWENGTALDSSSAPLPQNLSEIPGGATKLVLLNLWGCHNLRDDAANAMSSMNNLLSLCVSECHKLTDAFVVGISTSLPRLLHLQLRYVRRITDVGIDAIADKMAGLYSLDVSFCDRISAVSLANLLEVRRETLAELRLYSCRQLDVGDGRDTGTVAAVAVRGNNHRRTGHAAGDAGWRFLRALQPRIGGGSRCDNDHASNLSVLDLRKFVHHNDDDASPPAPYAFSTSMAALGFEEKLRGFFVRPARWNPRVETRLIEQLRSTTSSSSERGGGGGGDGGLGDDEWENPEARYND